MTEKGFLFVVCFKRGESFRMSSIQVINVSERRKSSTNCLNFPESLCSLQHNCCQNNLFQRHTNHEISEHYSIKRKLFCILPMNIFSRKNRFIKKSEINCGFDLNTKKSGKQKNSKIYFQPRIT